MERPPSIPLPLRVDSQSPRAKSSMLAWWGLIPATALIAIEVLYAWPHAKAHATAPEAAISYLIGHILGGLLVSFAIAWVTYRVGRRSQFAATIAFSITIGLSCLTVLAMSQQQPNRVITPSSTTPTMTSFGDFGFEIPAGWTRDQPDQKKTMAMILLNGAAWNAAEAMLKVDVGVPSFPTARELAEALAGKDGRVYQDPVSIGGSDGIRVEIPSTNLLRPRFAVVVFRDEKVYLIMAATAKGSDISGAFDQVLKTWRWNDTR